MEVGFIFNIFEMCRDTSLMIHSFEHDSKAAGKDTGALFQYTLNDIKKHWRRGS